MTLPEAVNNADAIAYAIPALQGNVMLTPGFTIRNDTIWPLQISLSQVGPLYYDVIQPGQSFTRDTGAVWFTIRASVFLDEKDRITDWDAIMPVAIIVGTVIFAAVTAGAAAYAGGPALAAAGAAGVSGVTGLSSASALATAMASSALVGAGFSASAALVIGGAVVGGGIGAAVSASTQAALKEIFKGQNISLSSAGCYAGPPWPFRREVTPLTITGGPTFRKVDGKDQVELVGGALHINAPAPPAAYGHFALQTGTVLPEDGGDFRFLFAANRDLFAIRTRNTGSGMTEVHVLSASSGYKAFSLQTATALGPTDDSWEFTLASNRDVIAISKRNNGSNMTEVHILEAAKAYKVFSLQTPTALPASSDAWTFSLANNRDLFAIKKSESGSGKTEVHVLAADTRYRQFSQQIATALHATDGRWSFAVAGNRDVFAFMRNGTGSGTMEVHVLDAASGYQSFAIQTKTALHEVDDTWSLGVSASREIVAVRRKGGGSASTELHIIAA